MARSSSSRARPFMRGPSRVISILPVWCQTHLRSNGPPRSGRRESFPEIDRVLWVERDEAAMLLNEALVAFVDWLIEHLSNGPSLD